MANAGIGMTDATAGLPPDDLTLPPSPETLVIAEMAARIDRLNHQISILTEATGENWQRFKNAVTDSGTPATTLQRRIKSQNGQPPVVKSRVDEHGDTWVEVNSALCARFEQAPRGG